MSVIFKKIQQDIDENPIVLYMKGTKTVPQCGFSAILVQILTQLGLDFKAVNVLVDQELRQAIKDFSNWPTIPQLYIKGEFIGGCDIVREMFQSGELQALLKEKNLLD
ncbi:MAG: Grx4 family monothiol glutaredoxin [Proteobacteria bacterium]|nr:Grx4 family monothiol glutaredoxin [Pseudomonadota bacterium]